MVKQNRTSSVLTLPDCLEVVVQDLEVRAIGRPWVEVVVQDQGVRAIGRPWVELILVHADRITLVELFMVMV